MTTAPATSSTESVDYDPFVQGEIQHVVPTTESQRELWLSVKIGEAAANCAYNESVSLEIKGALDTTAFEKAWSQLVRRHEALRGVISADGLTMSIRPTVDGSLMKLDVSGDARQDVERKCQERVVAETLTVFDLENGPLFRAVLIRLAEDEHLFVFTAHHIVCDGWSAAVLLDELGSLYSSERSGHEYTPEEQPGFAAYALSERSETGRRAEEASERYWVEQYCQGVSRLELPLEKKRPDVRTFDAERIDWVVPAPLFPNLKKLGTDVRATFVATLFSAFSAYLARLTKTEVVAVGVPSAGQSATGHKYLVGHCVNTLPVVVTVNPESTFFDHLKMVREVLLKAHEHRDFSFGSLVKKVTKERDPSRVPLISVLFNVDTPIDCKNFDDLEVTFRSNPRSYENFEISLNAVERGEELVLETTYNTGLFSRAEIESRLGEFAAFLESVVHHPEAKVGDLELLPPSEKHQLLTAWNDTEVSLSGVPLTHQMVEERAMEAPGRVAVEFGGRGLSFGELNERANRLARLFVERGVTPGSLVGVCLRRGPDLITALLAVLKAGGAYVPIDPAYPTERIKMIIEDAAPPFLVTEASLVEGLKTTISAPLLVIDQERESIDAREAGNLGLDIAPDGLAYVIFTSGSTGRPKGVQIPHRAFQNFLRSMAKSPGFTADQRLLAVTTVSFDIAGLEIFLPLTQGGTIVLASEEMALDGFALKRTLESDGIDLLQATPATFRMLLEVGWTGNSNLKILCGGEPFPPDLAEALLSRCGSLFNMYGPTETTVWSTLQRVESVDGSSVPVGRPIDNTQIYILDANLRPVPVGVEGELFIGGLGLARGYHNRDDLTDAAFLKSPFVEGERIYRTGDIARWLSSGLIEHRGRRDAQIKLRGYRIELGEIEAALGQVPNTREVAVILREDRPGDKQLVAYITWENGAALDTRALREIVGARLPHYMVPGAFVSLEEMPLTPARKIDRKNLPAPVHDGESAAASGSVERPQSDDEAWFVSLFRELLQTNAVGRSSDFFELGGHSLLAIQMATRVSEHFETEFSVATIFRGATPAALATEARKNSQTGQNERPLILQLARGSSPINLFFVCGVNIYSELAEALGAPYNSYGIFVPAELNYLKSGGEGLPDDFTTENLARDYLAAIREVQPHGPYFLTGVSFGGVLAYEVAQQLRAEGEEIAFLGLLDSLLPRSIKFRPDRFLTALVSPKSGTRKEIFGRLTRRFRGNPEDAARGDRPSSSAQQFEADVFQLREQAYESAMQNYDRMIPAYDGAVTIFRATDHSEYPHHSIARDCGWGKVVTELKIVDVPGTHLGILQGSSAELIADEMRAQFRRLE